MLNAGASKVTENLPNLSRVSILDQSELIAFIYRWPTRNTSNQITFLGLVSSKKYKDDQE